MTNVISVRFRGGCKTYYFDPRELTVQDGDDVIVETNQGLEFVHCTQGNHPVADSMVVQPLRPVLRLATENDRRTAQLCRQKEKDAFRICQKKIAEHKLEMKLVRRGVHLRQQQDPLLLHRRRARRLPRAGEGPRVRVPHAHRAAPDRRARRGEDARRARHLRPAVLLLASSWSDFAARIHQDGQGRRASR